MGKKDNNCSMLNKPRGLKQHKPEKIGINRLGDEIVYVAGDRVITRSSATGLKCESIA